MRKIQSKSCKLSVDKINLIKFPSVLSSVWTNIADGKSLTTSVISALPHLVEVFGVELKNTIGAQAFSAYTLAFMRSLCESLKDHGMEPKEFKIPEKSKLKTVYDFETFSKSNPINFPLYDDLRAEFIQILLDQNISEENVTKIIKPIPSKFPKNLQEIISENKSFEAFYKYYDISDTDNLEMFFEKQKIMCINECRKPLSLDPDLNLEEIYVTPACRYKFNDNSQDDENIKNKLEKKEDRGEFKDNIITEVKSIVQNTSDNNHIIFVKGEPGHGKTSFVKFFLKEMASLTAIEDPDYILLYIPLSKSAHLIEYGIFKAIAKKNGLQDLPESYFNNRDVILVLDGLDEILIADIDYRNHVKNEINNLNMFIQDKPRFKVIVTCRNQCFETHKNAFPANYHVCEILDFTEDKQGEKKQTKKVNLWIEKYLGLKKHLKNKDQISIKNFKKHKLHEFIGQPVLLTFISQMFLDDEFLKDIKDTGGEIKNRADIYEKIVHYTLRREWDEKARDIKISEKYKPECIKLNKQILNKIGYSIFTTKNSSEPTTTTKKEIKSNLTDEIKDKISDLNLNEEVFLDVTKVMFYFKETNLFEFSHLSFRDYFTAKEIINNLMEIQETWKVKDAQDSLIKRLYKLLGYRILDNDQLDFIKEICISLDEKDCLKIAKFLADRFSSFKKHEYMEKIPQTDIYTAEVFVLKNLLPLIVIFKKKQTDIYEFDSILDYLDYQNFLGSFKYEYSIHCIEYSYLKMIKINNLIAPSLYIPRADLFGANLSGADLSGADLTLANLTGAYLSGADLTLANLTDAYLTDADLTLANLTRADLTLANLTRANLFGADLSDANLSGAYLTRANLTDANLTDAYFFDADFFDADLFGADLSGADLFGANLTDAQNITVDQIKMAQNWKKAKYSDEFRKQLGLE